MKNNQIAATGIGFRLEHADQILRDTPEVPWFEILIDNYMANNAPLSIIDKLVEKYPISFHGVGLSIGTVEDVDYRYLKKLSALKERWQPQMISDHFAWSRTATHNFHELLPLVLNKQNIEFLVNKIEQVQDYIGKQVLFENTSTYIEAPAEMEEWDFINQVCRISGCGLLLDVNNIHVNAFNHNFDPNAYIQGINLNHVKEIHVAGYEDRGDHYFDSHGKPVAPEVWDSFAEIMKAIPSVPALLEWDNELPNLNVLLDESRKAEKIRAFVLREKAKEEEAHVDLAKGKRANKKRVVAI